MANAPASFPWQDQAPVLPWQPVANGEPCRREAEQTVEESRAAQQFLESQNAELRRRLRDAEAHISFLEREVTMARHAYYGILYAPAPCATCNNWQAPAQDQDSFAAEETPPLAVADPIVAVLVREEDQQPSAASVAPSQAEAPSVPTLPVDLAPLVVQDLGAREMEPSEVKSSPLPKESLARPPSPVPQPEVAADREDGEDEAEQKGADREGDEETAKDKDASLQPRHPGRVVCRAGNSTSRSRRKRQPPSKRAAQPAPSTEAETAPAPPPPPSGETQRPPKTSAEKRRAKRREQRAAARESKKEREPHECTKHTGTLGSRRYPDLLWCCLFYAHSSVAYSAAAFVEALKRALPGYGLHDDFSQLVERSERMFACLWSGEYWKAYTCLSVEETCALDWNHGDVLSPLRALYTGWDEEICAHRIVQGLVAETAAQPPLGSSASAYEQDTLELRRTARSLRTACLNANDALEKCHPLLSCRDCVAHQRQPLGEKSLFAHWCVQVRNATPVANLALQCYLSRGTFVLPDARDAAMPRQMREEAALYLVTERKSA